MTQAYPLHWPAGFPRTKSQKPSRFKTSLPGAVRNRELDLTPAVAAYHVLVQGATIITSPGALRPCLHGAP